MATGKDILADMGIDLNEAIDIDQKLKNKKPRDRRICLCGHAVVRHMDEFGAVQCRANKWNCKCKAVQPVLEVEDTRIFMRKTEGPGAFHALSRGIVSASGKGHTMSWIDGALYCHKCKKTDERVTVVPVTQHGIAQDADTGFNVFLCDTCRTA